MESEVYWNWFLQTGDPLAYMMYRSAEEKTPQEEHS